MPIKNAPSKPDFVEPAHDDDEFSPAVGATPVEPEPTAVAQGDASEDDDEYEYFRMPNGRLRAVRKLDIQDMNATDVENPNVPQEEFYLHLADGSVERVKNSELPGHAGSNAVHGFYVRENKTYQIVGVYPVETEVKES